MMAPAPPIVVRPADKFSESWAFRRRPV